MPPEDDPPLHVSPDVVDVEDPGSPRAYRHEPAKKHVYRMRAAGSSPLGNLDHRYARTKGAGRVEPVQEEVDVAALGHQLHDSVGSA